MTRGSVRDGTPPTRQRKERQMAKAKKKAKDAPSGKAKAGSEATQHPGDLGRRHRHRQPELLHARAHGLPDAQHRPHRPRGHVVHRFLWRTELHRRPFVVHHWPERASYRPVEGRHPGRTAGDDGVDRHHRRRCSRTAVTRPASSARTTSAISTSTCRRCTASTNSSATSTTSMPRKSRRWTAIRRIRAIASSSGRAACCTAGRRTRTTRPRTRAGAAWASRRSRTPAR